MRSISMVLALLVVAVLDVEPVRADPMRPIEKRDEADFILSGIVTAVYTRETTGYRDFIIEIKVEQVEKGAGIKQGEPFRAFCYQRKEGKGGLEFDTAGHKTVPNEGQRVRAFINRAGGRNEGVYPDWIDIVAEKK